MESFTLQLGYSGPLVRVEYERKNPYLPSYTGLNDPSPREMMEGEKESAKHFKASFTFPKPLGTIWLTEEPRIEGSFISSEKLPDQDIRISYREDDGAIGHFHLIELSNELFDSEHEFALQLQTAKIDRDRIETRKAEYRFQYLFVNKLYETYLGFGEESIVKYFTQGREIPKEIWKRPLLELADEVIKLTGPNGYKSHYAAIRAMCAKYTNEDGSEIKFQSLKTLVSDRNRGER